jgi:hypothetical protein
MVAGYHLMWTAYSCWLPNDPRGSSSAALRSERIASLGDSHPGRKTIQPSGKEIRDFYQLADDILSHPRRIFSGEEALVIANSLANTVKDRAYTCHACAIMPDHVHMLIRRHRDNAESMIEFFQEESKKALIQAGLRAVNHPVGVGRAGRCF